MIFNEPCHLVMSKCSPNSLDLLLAFFVEITSLKEFICKWEICHFPFNLVLVNWQKLQWRTKVHYQLISLKNITSLKKVKICPYIYVSFVGQNVSPDLRVDFMLQSRLARKTWPWPKKRTHWRTDSIKLRRI